MEYLGLCISVLSIINSFVALIFQKLKFEQKYGFIGRWVDLKNSIFASLHNRLFSVAMYNPVGDIRDYWFSWYNCTKATKKWQLQHFLGIGNFIGCFLKQFCLFTFCMFFFVQYNIIFSIHKKNVLIFWTSGHKTNATSEETK